MRVSLLKGPPKNAISYFYTETKSVRSNHPYIYIWVNTNILIPRLQCELKRAKSAPNFSRAKDHAGPFWTERVKIVLDATNWAHLISELATLKATLELLLNLALSIAK